MPDRRARCSPPPSGTTRGARARSCRACSVPRTRTSPGPRSGWARTRSSRRRCPTGAASPTSSPTCRSWSSCSPPRSRCPSRRTPGRERAGAGFADEEARGAGPVRAGPLVQGREPQARAARRDRADPGAVRLPEHPGGARPGDTAWARPRGRSWSSAPAALAATTRAACARLLDRAAAHAAGRPGRAGRRRAARPAPSCRRATQRCPVRLRLGAPPRRPLPRRPGGAGPAAARAGHPRARRRPVRRRRGCCTRTCTGPASRSRRPATTCCAAA